MQGGTGHATDVNGVNRTAEVFNHGPTQGISDALDAMTEWVANSVRAPIMPDPADDVALAAGRALFEASCASCHGGAKWTKSQTASFYAKTQLLLTIHWLLISLRLDGNRHWMRI